jgi:uncharacterized protein YndB with AHSA1/START domain
LYKRLQVEAQRTKDAEMTDTTSPDTIDGLDRDYQARVAIDAPPDAVFDALTTLDGLAAWWTTVTGNGLAGGELTFHFGPESEAVMRVDVAERGVEVRWTNTACMMADWVGTTVRFELAETSSGTTELHFRHAGLTPRLECFADCKSGWDHFIPSLRAYVETGRGNPNQSEADLARRADRARRHEAARSS